MFYSEEREAFICTYQIMSVRGKLYGPRELRSYLIRMMGREYHGSFSLRFRRDVVDAFMSDDERMMLCRGMVPSAVYLELESTLFRAAP